MSRRYENKGFEEGFIPDSAQTRGSGKQQQLQTARGRQQKVTWRGESDKEESLSQQKRYTNAERCRPKSPRGAPYQSRMHGKNPIKRKNQKASEYQNSRKLE